MAGPLFETRITGLDQLIRDLDATEADVAAEIPGALFVEAEKIMTEAKKLVPVDEGVLRASGHVELPRVVGDWFAVDMGFGGPAGSGQGQTKDVGYAVYVHEDLTAHHVVGQAKFLEVPFNRAKAGLGGRLMERIRRRLARR